MKDGVTHRYIIIVIIRADTNDLHRDDAKNLTSKLSRKKIMSKILLILDTVRILEQASGTSIN